MCPRPNAAMKPTPGQLNSFLLIISVSRLIEVSL
jgi:hypothetical protein